MYTVHSGIKKDTLLSTKGLFATAILILTMVISITSTMLTQAKGGETQPVTNPSTSYSIIQGPCAYEWVTDSGHVTYPLQHNTYPGTVVVDMIWDANSVPTVQTICLDTGWTATVKAVSGGVQVRFNYNGARAIDFKFVLGKTDIRNY